MNQINHSIACTVDTCAHHAGKESYCTLDCIRVGGCTPEVTRCSNTECASFQTGRKG